MAELLLEVALRRQLTAETLIIGGAGFIKMGDLISDCFFVKEVGEYRDLVDKSVSQGVQDDIYYFDAIYISVLFFTVIGFLFDFFKAYVYLKERRNTQPDADGTQEGDSMEERHYCCEHLKFWEEEDEAKDEWVWWKRWNFVFEEIPQLVLVIFFFTEIGLEHVVVLTSTDPDDPGRPVLSDEELQDRSEREEAQLTAVIVSVVFTVLNIGMTFFRFGRARGWWWCSQGGNTEDGGAGDSNETTGTTEEPCKQWRCGQCTSFNESLALACVICSTERTTEEPCEQWRCSQCTSFNESLALACDICSTERT
jgi:hypothetical protein